MGMLQTMSQAKNAIEAYNAALEVTSSNIANMSVTGYKRMNVSFQSIFERTLSMGTAASADGSRGGTNPEQLGQGMSISNIGIDFSAGEYVSGTNLDLAINGSGLFIVSPDGGASYNYTRAGNFTIDSSGNLLSNNLQVYGLDRSGNLTPISGLPSGNQSDYQWTAGGKLQYTSDGGSTYVDTGFSIALTYFTNPQGLVQAQGTSFRATSASGPAAAPTGPGGATGTLLPGQKEQSNVFYLGESIDALELERAMNGNLTIVNMASNIIQQFISKLS